MVNFLSDFLPEITQNVTNSIAPSVFVSDYLYRLPPIKEGRTAMYVSSSDTVYIPNNNDFNTENEYYRTLFHELVHSTGHKNRLNRHLGNNFEDYYYTHEELIAEFGSILLSLQCGIFTDNIPLHYQYINEWYRVLWFYSCGKTTNESINYCIKQARLSVEFLSKAGRKISHGSTMYKEKAAVIEHLESLIKSSTYNNWGERKEKDSPDVLGYLNFKSKLIIDGKKRHIRISVILNKDRKTKLKSFEVGNKKSGSFRKATVVNPLVEGNKPLTINKTTKNNSNHQKGLHKYLEKEQKQKQKTFKNYDISKKEKSRPERSKNRGLSVGGRDFNNKTTKNNPNHQKGLHKYQGKLILFFQLFFSQ